MLSLKSRAKRDKELAFDLDYTFIEENLK